ncbi:MAG: hypothetical protein F4X76_01050 [Chloroflexi bacterium]|nr:hypothetical protein [Chloroflexota bacterium]
MSEPRTPNLPGPDEWPTWTLIERERLEVAREERPFLEAAAGLVTEFGELAALLVRAWSPPPAGARASARDEAILCALAVRIVKLTRRLAAETYEGRAELQLLLDREIFVSTSAMAYLLRGGGERFEAFVSDSLRADRGVWGHLDGNRELRDGEVLPMEQRMRERLARSFELAGVDPEEAVGEAESGWPSLDEQLAAIGEPAAHRMHQLGADSIHGLWNELHTHHLRAEGREGAGDLGPRLEWTAAQVQPLTAVAIQASRVMAAWSRRIGHEAAEAFRDKFLDLAGRAALVDRFHEEYLARSERSGLDDLAGGVEGASG